MLQSSACDILAFEPISCEVLSQSGVLGLHFRDWQPVYDNIHINGMWGYRLTLQW